MNKSINIITKFVLFILSVLFILIIIKAVLHRDYPTLIKYLSTSVGIIVYQVIVSKVIKPFGLKVKNKDLFNSLIWFTFAALFITNFVFSLILRNSFFGSINEGLIYPSVYFAMKYWDLWMEDNEVGNSE
jgi:hypothetical protein